MPTVSEKSLRAALGNIAHFGDTDVLPFPLERQWFAGDEDSVILLLQSIDSDFDEYVGAYPVTFVKSLTGVGYNGFRAVTQIDPLWNAYLLALVLEIAPDLEHARLPIEREVVFSYRYAPDSETGGLFDKKVGWRAFQTTALKHARESKYVLATDISDFYPRVYHHRLENAVMLATSNKDAARRILVLLLKLSEGTSYGLPIGGNAARLLAEILLNRVDRLLLTASVKFCRFVDDYAIFATSREEAQRALVTLSDLLLRNEGLTLARAKSRRMSSAEFIRGSPLAEPEKADSEEESEAKKFLRIRWSYDPYSPTATEDYDELVEEVNKFDVVSMLAREFRKTRIDESLVRQLVRSIKYVAPSVRDRAVLSLADNLSTLYPVFPTVAILLRALLADLSSPVQNRIFFTLRTLLREKSHITMVPANAAYAARLLAFDRDEEVDVLLSQRYWSENSDAMLRRDIIYIMARREAYYWLSDLLKRHLQLTSWELRALLVASYALGDEGKHWRKHREKELSAPDLAFLQWIGQMNNGKMWEIPV
jgi:hypothetical protein